jgi:hypothetical protein
LAQGTGEVPKLSKKSIAIRNNAHFDIQRVLNLAITRFDFTILCSHRNMADQEKAKAEGKSNAHFGASPHNYVPAVAVDIAPYPVNWGEEGTPEEKHAALKRFYDLSVVMLQCAKELNVPLRWGGDWDGNPSTPNKLTDLPHYELHPWRSFVRTSKDAIA